MSSSNQPFLLSGGFQPQPTEFDLEVSVDGDWPQGLNGCLYRIGPNPQFPPRGTYNPFLGDGMVHAFQISAGKVSYRNRWVRTQQWVLENAAGEALFATSGDPRDHDPSVAGLRTDGVANTSLVWLAGKLLCLEEGHLPIEIDPHTLDTKGVCSFGGGLTSNLTAHPKLDPATGELIGFANYPNGRYDGDINLYTLNNKGSVTRSVTVRAPFPGLVHDFAVTDNFIVLPIGPATISIERAMTGGPPIAWEPDRNMHIGVMPRAGSAADIVWLERPAGFVWHLVNAWDENGVITVDVCEQRAPMFPGVDGEMPPAEDNCQYLTRWRLEPGARAPVQVARLAEVVCEYPRFDERFTMRPIAHAYFASNPGTSAPDPFYHAISHFDYARGQMNNWEFAATEAVNEPVFVAAGHAAEEGEGLLLTTVYDGQTDRSALVVFDAQRVADGPLAKAQLSHRVPIGFHGAWLSESALS